MGKSLNFGFMLVEVLIALALFGLSAVILVDGAFVATRVAREMEDTRELEQDLIWARSQILAISDYATFSEGGDIEALSMGMVTWGTEVEMTDVLDLYKVLLRLEYDGNEDYGIEPGMHESAMYLLRPAWGSHSDFSSERNQLLDDRRRKMKEHQADRRRNSP